jgi:hypothetical protein
MRSAAWLCGPRHTYSLPPAPGAPVSWARLANTAALPFRFLLSLPPQFSPSDTRAAASMNIVTAQRTLLQEVIRGGHWHMLEPSGGEQVSKKTTEIARSAALSAALCVQGVVSPQADAGVSQTSRDSREHAVDLYNNYRSRAVHIASHDAETEESNSAGDGSSDPYSSYHDQEDSGRQLLQLVQRKWTRLYTVHFFRVALLRTLTVLFAWGAVIVRAGLVSPGGPDGIDCEAEYESIPGGSAGSCYVVKVSM